MSEGWEDCPVLGPGWKRRSVVRKSGASCGHMDSYYLSPTGMRFRSKVEMQKHLGGSVDLSLFDFKNGVILSREKRKKEKKRQSFPPDTGVNLPAKKQRLSLPLPTIEEQQNGAMESSLVRCESCKVWFAGVYFGKSKQNVWHCSDCRAFRRAQNKQQQYFRNIGCGTCAACKLPENCGYCTVCLLRSQNPEFGSSWKCVKRRCLQAIRKGGGCGTCEGCIVTENCGGCSICIKKAQNPGKKIKGKCLKRRCLHKEIVPQPDLQNITPTKISIKLKPLSERVSSSLPSKHKKKHPLVNKVKSETEQKGRHKQRIAGRRTNRKCGECEACLQKLDCGECDFCQDKPKFGGRNLKRQKCRWRQCLRFAMEKNIPSYHRASNHPVLLERMKMEEEEPYGEYMQSEQQDLQPLTPAIVPVVKLENLELPNRRCADEFPKTFLGDTTVPSVLIKQEKEDPGVTNEGTESLNLHHSITLEEFISESDDIAEADESTPVIMEIFSLGSYHAMNPLDSVLQEFMSELNEIPLPAHWEVQADIGPNLQLVQRSKISTMADTVIHIQPGLHFQVVVKSHPVPPFHELYSNHPSRLTTVDEVVELICDLEAYRPCAGISTTGQYSPDCSILIYEERCPQCCKIPWPSGSGL